MFYPKALPCFTFFQCIIIFGIYVKFLFQNLFHYHCHPFWCSMLRYAEKLPERFRTNIWILQSFPNSSRLSWRRKSSAASNNTDSGGIFEDFVHLQGCDLRVSPRQWNHETFFKIFTLSCKNEPTWAHLEQGPQLSKGGIRPRLQLLANIQKTLLVVQNYKSTKFSSPYTNGICPQISLLCHCCWT